MHVQYWWSYLTLKSAHFDGSTGFGFWTRREPIETLKYSLSDEAVQEENYAYVAIFFVDIK
jgi:hypothetical protein